MKLNIGQLKLESLQYLKKNKALLGKYVFSGFASMTIEFLLFYFLINSFNVNVVVASNVSLLCSGTFNYFLSRYWVFEKTSNVKKEILLFALIFFLSILINNAVFLFSLRFLKYNPMLSKFVAMCVSTGFNYLTKKYLVFREFSL